MKLHTLADLADDLQISVAEAEALRRRHRWPHVKAGRSNVRFTDTQIAAIIAQHTVDSDVVRKAPASNGQTAGSAKRSA